MKQQNCIILRRVNNLFSRENQMTEYNIKRNRVKIIAISCTIMLTTIVIWAGCKKHPHEPTVSGYPGQTQPERGFSEQTETKPFAQDVNEIAKTNVVPDIKPEVSLYDVIKAAKTWRPAYTSWYGKPAPDFTLSDLAGKEHKLSNYHGKDVLLIFWATWCPPCQMEVPFLIELRKTIGEDKLAMLAVTNEKPDVAEKFIADHSINYTILLDKDDMPAPFGFMRIYRATGVPCSFFINSDGKIKLATSGLVSLGEIRAILQAE